MADDTIYVPIDASLTLFGAYVSNFSFSLGWNGSPSTLNVTLIEAPEDGKNFTQPSTSTVGILDVNENFRFMGVVESWEYVKDTGGKVISMAMKDLRSLAATASVVIYPYDSMNSLGTIIDAYGYFNTGADGNNSGWSIETGMPWDKVREAIQNTYFSFGGSNFQVVLSSLPPMPDGYRINANIINLLDLIQKVATDGGFDFFIDVSNISGVIRFIPADRTGPYAGLNLTNWLNARRGLGVNGHALKRESVGIENRNMSEAVGAVLMGAPKEEMIAIDQENNIHEYWTHENPTKPVVDLNHIKHENYILAGDGTGFGKYLMTEYELHGALTNFDTWYYTIMTRQLSRKSFGPSPLAQDLHLPQIVDNSNLTEANAKNPNTLFGKVFLTSQVEEAFRILRLDASFNSFLKAIYNEYKRVAELWGQSFWCKVDEFQALLSSSIQQHYRPKQLVGAAYNGDLDTFDRIQEFFYNGDTKKMSGYVIFDDIDDNFGVPELTGTSNDFIYCYPSESTDAQEGIDRPGNNAGRLFVRANFKLIQNEKLSDDPVVWITLSSKVILKDEDPWYLILPVLNACGNGSALAKDLTENKISVSAKMLAGVKDFRRRGFTLTVRDGSYFGNIPIKYDFSDTLGPDYNRIEVAVRRSGLTGVVIPAVSVRETYGPWAAGAVYVSDGEIYKRAGWHGKIDIQQQADYAPWNFESEDDMNEAGESYVSRRITQLPEIEEGNYSVTGLPELSPGAYIGTNANISDINVIANANGGVVTTYYIHAFSPRYAEASKESLDSLSQKTIKQAETDTKEAYFRRSVYQPQIDKTYRELLVAGEERESILGDAAAAITATVTGFFGTQFVPGSVAVLTQTVPSLIDAASNMFRPGQNNNNNKAAAQLGSFFAPFMQLFNLNTNEFQTPTYEQAGKLPVMEQPTETNDKTPLDYRAFDKTKDCISVGEDGYMKLDLDDFNPEKVYSMALKAPIWIAGWGFDEEGNVVPDKDYLEARGASFESSDPSDAEVEEYAKTYIPAWKIGPLDVRWDDERKVWVAGGGIGIHRHLKENTSTLGGGIGFACYFPSEGYDFLGEEA